MDYEVVWSGGALLPDYPWASGLAVPGERIRSSASRVRVWKEDDAPTALPPGRARVYCACGCGERIVTKDWRRCGKVGAPRFLRGHHTRMRHRKAANPTPWRGRFFKSGL